MDWIEVTIETTAQGIEPLSDRLIAVGVGGFSIEDEEDFETFLATHGEYWDYVDEELRGSKRGKHLIKLYVAANESGMDDLMAIKQSVATLQKDVPEIDLGSLEFHMETMNEEDWANNWKQYYKPFPVGNKFFIHPAWETLDGAGDRKVLTLNPGMSFGTGMHHTTNLCLELIEENPASEMLDLGCGSGILSIGGLLLGARHATGIDIDINAAHIAMENAALNGFDERSFTPLCGDILTDEELLRTIAEKKYDLITANIVADVIIPLMRIVPYLLAPGGAFIISGIIAPRADEVTAAATAAGFEIHTAKTREDWCAYVLHQKFV